MIRVAEARQTDSLVGLCRRRGFRVFGPRAKDGAIAYDEIASAADLAVGWSDQQDRGRYRLSRSESTALFGCVSAAQSWKRLLHPPRVPLWQAERDGKGFRVLPDEHEALRYAFIGVRPCELAAIRALDRVLLDGPFVDVSYKRRRESSLIVVANCTRAGGTCFCTSMATGPRAESGYDLALTELLDEERHDVLIEVGSALGAEVASEVSAREASAEDRRRAEAAIERARTAIGRSLDTQGLSEMFLARADDAHWEDVGRRCLACGNCTLVCPTCFCVTLNDLTDLEGGQAVREKAWDSCFSLAFTRIHGGSVRASTAARYRHWITHKLVSWHDQFGTSGCVGCGRCITWCPAGIDITEEVRTLRARGRQGGAQHGG